MARNRYITHEAREYVIDQLHDKGELSKSEVVELLRPHCSFDPIQLQEQKLGELAASIIHGIRDSSGVRSAFIIRKMDTVIDIETCRTLEKVKAVEEQLSRQIDGLRLSRNKALNRRQELEGQMSVFATK